MAEAFPSPLEAGGGAIGGTGHETALRIEIAQARFGREDREHFLRVWGPIGCEVHLATAFEALGQQTDERRLNQSPLVMSLLRPGIGKKHENFIETRRRQMALKYFHGVMADHPDIPQRKLLQAEQNPTDARTMDLDAQKIPLRVRCSECEQVLAIAEPDLDGTGGRPTEHLVEIDQPVRLNAVFGPQRLERSLLRRGNAPGPRDEGADRARVLGLVQPPRR